MKPIFYLEEVWIEGHYNMDFPPFLVLRKRTWWIFYKTIVDFGILDVDEKRYIKINKTADRYCHLLNLLYKNK